MRNYLIEYRDGCEEIIQSALDIRDAREEAQGLHDSQIKRIRVIRKPDELPSKELQLTE